MTSEAPQEPPAGPGAPAEGAAGLVHTYERGITADLLHKVGGYPGLTAEARTALTERHPCRSDAPDADLAVVFESNNEAFVTVRAEVPCTDTRCWAITDAARQAERDHTAAIPWRLRALIDTVTPHLAPPADEPAEVTHTWELGYNTRLLREQGGIPGLIEELREELADTYPCRHDTPDADLPATVTTDANGFTTVTTAFSCADPRCLARESTGEAFDKLSGLVKDLREQAGELLPAAASEHLIEAEELLVPPLWQMPESPDPLRTVDPAHLRAVWVETRQAVQAQLRAVAEAIEPYAARP